MAEVLVQHVITHELTAAQSTCVTFIGSPLWSHAHMLQWTSCWHTTPTCFQVWSALVGSAKRASTDALRTNKAVLHTPPASLLSGLATHLLTSLQLGILNYAHCNRLLTPLRPCASIPACIRLQATQQCAPPHRARATADAGKALQQQTLARG
jgi:hypothetical protein